MKTVYGVILALIILLASCKGSASPAPAPAWMVSTLAGSGTSGHQDGVAATAQFNEPYGVAVGSSGNVYVADKNNNRIRKITPNGIVSDFAGSGKKDYRDNDDDEEATDAWFNWPYGVAVDSSGNVYVADRNNDRIRKITEEDDAGDETWTVSTLAGSGTQGHQNGVGTDARFNRPAGVAVDSSGNVYVADQDNDRIRKITEEENDEGDKIWRVKTIAGDGMAGHQDDQDNTVTTTARFHNPSGVAVDLSGNVYVADTSNDRVRKITEEKNDEGDKVWKVKTIAGSGTRGHKDGVGTDARFSRPTGVAVDSSGNIYVADQNNHRIRKITETEEVDDDGNKIWKVSTLAGSGTAGYRDGAAAEARFNSPTGVALDSSGNVYVADESNHRIRKIEYRVP